MRFRLVYEGPLRSLSEEDRDDKKSLRRGTEKQNIRKFFHPQLKELWNTNKLLSTTKIPKGGRQVAIPIDANHGGFSFYSSSKMVASEERPLVDYVADQYPQFGYKFVPLVREKWTLACGLEILFLRRDPPGSLWTAGDIDNRVKTLIDGLRMPKCVAELGDYKDPAADETPFFCLLEEDKSVTALTVETDTLLKPLPPDGDASWAHVVITADVRPYAVTTFNLALA